MRLVLAFSACLLLAGGVRGQEQPAPDRPVIGDPVKADEYGNIDWGDERARLDNVALHLMREPNDFVMYLVAYGGRRACVGEAKARALRARGYLMKRGIRPDRVAWIDGGHREKQTVEVWVLPRDIGPPYAAPTVEERDVRLRRCKPNGRAKRGRHNS